MSREFWPSFKSADRRDRFPPLRIAVLALLLWPLALAAWNAEAIMAGRGPVNDLIHRAGFWALMFLMITLAITPLCAASAGSGSSSTSGVCSARHVLLRRPAHFALRARPEVRPVDVGERDRQAHLSHHPASPR